MKRTTLRMRTPSLLRHRLIRLVHILPAPTATLATPLTIRPRFLVSSSLDHLPGLQSLTSWGVLAYPSTYRVYSTYTTSTYTPSVTYSYSTSCPCPYPTSYSYSNSYSTVCPTYSPKYPPVGLSASAASSGN